MLNFVTKQSLNETSGGWSGISANIHQEMQRRFPTTYVGPINPPIPLASKVLSKVVRCAGGRGGLPVFGSSRLSAFEKAWRQSRDPCARFDLFHAATEWSECRPEVPYGAYVDATFRTYMDIYSTPEAFLERDVNTIADKEGEFMRGATALFFGSRWARDIAVREHGLNPDRTHVLWVGGNVPVPEGDIFGGGHRFIFISLNFEKKGGRVAVEALQILREKHPEAELLVLGERPPSDVLELPGVVYGGILRKTVPDELAVFCEHLAHARAIVHPTSMDTMGAVLIEAGYFGCPSIATRRFGIPELVLHGDTGMLIDLPISVDQLAGYMIAVSQDGEAYEAMRHRVRKDMVDRLTWHAFGQRMATIIERSATHETKAVRG